MNADTSEFFSNASLLISRLGDWPSFHDAEILHLEMRRKPEVVLLMEVFVFAKNPSVVTLLFRGVEDLEIGGWNQQNVVFGLPVFRRADGRLLVNIDDIFGLGGSFTCSGAEVTEVRASEIGPPVIDSLPSPMPPPMGE
jgi:hypothetical protein